MYINSQEVALKWSLNRIMFAMESITNFCTNGIHGDGKDLLDTIKIDYYEICKHNETLKNNEISVGLSAIRRFLEYKKVIWEATQ